HGERTEYGSRGACPRTAKPGNREQVPRHGRFSPTHDRRGPDERGVVAESVEPEDSAPALPPVRSDGQGIQLRGRIQEPRPGRRDPGPPCLDDDVAGLVAGRLRPLWAVFHSY